MAAAIASALLLILFASGVFLHLAYRPTAVAAWPDIASLSTSVSYAQLVRRIHGAAALPSLVAVLGAVVMSITRSRRWTVSVAALVAALTALVSGPLLPWDQLALWRVTVGSRMTGYFPLYSDDVRYALVNGRQISIGELLTWLWVHTAAGVLALVLTAWMLRRRSLGADAVGVGEDEQVDERWHDQHDGDTERDHQPGEHG